eukprot:scaffold6032_cov100-Cylindrotheca_fusiformis.AAC.6
MEIGGIEPPTFCMQSRRSTPELNPHVQEVLHTRFAAGRLLSKNKKKGIGGRGNRTRDLLHAKQTFYH